FAMVYAGAKGATEQAMNKTLSYTLPQADVAPTFKLLNDDLMTRGNHEARGEEDTARSLHVANGAWIEKTFPVKQSYQDQMKAAFGAGLQLADFIKAPDAEKDKINKWVADQTEDRIQNIIPSGAITPDTRMVLANAIYFKNSWQFAFGEKS